MKVFGIDVSKWQGNFDFAAAKEQGVKFVILRGAYHKTKDTKFEQFYTSCKSLNLPVGVYQYSMARTVAEAKAEAEYLYQNCLKGKRFEYPIYIDIEDKTQLALPKKLLTDIAVAWCECLEAKGFYVGIYAGQYQFRDNMDDSRLKSYSHWIPQWGAKCTYDDNSVLDMWQFGGEVNKLRSNVIAGVVTDQNYAYKDFPAIIKAKKLNGYNSSATVQKVPASNASTPQTVFKEGDRITLKSGAKYSNGFDIPAWVRKQKLYIRSAEGKDGTYCISTLKTGDITGRVHKKYLAKA